MQEVSSIARQAGEVFKRLRAAAEAVRFCTLPAFGVVDADGLRRAADAAMEAVRYS